jgi:hypothetical protein
MLNLNALRYDSPESHLTDLEEDAIIAEAMRLLENRMLDKLERKLVREGEVPENQCDFQLFLRSGFLGVDIETRGKLLNHIQQKRGGEK